ncbi:SGNH hydrolase domain-containing protein [Aquihabitans sp. G128]|uniref:SGNH hydrolase domain-containing protein n=1 Tax=Aquihabitans sp. G128 TaxID=2849779 RepID=UPI0020B1EF02|nr:SGNH hydrolase domain-containing protein [Aquihabitans sp. G128]
MIGDGEPQAYPSRCAQAGQAEDLGLQGRPDVVLLWVGAWEVYDQVVDGTRLEVGSDAYADLLESRLQQRIDTYRAHGVPAVLPVVPCFGPPVPSLGVERVDPDRVAWVNERIRRVAARNRGWVRLIDPTRTLCDADGRARTATPDGIALREDGTHLSEQAAVWFWDRWLSGQLEAAFPPAER